MQIKNIKSKRIKVLLVNWLFCIAITILFRCLVAIPHRWILGWVSPNRFYAPWDGFPWILLFLAPFFFLCIYYSGTGRSGGGLTMGERCVGIRVITERKVWHGVLEALAVAIYPVAFLYACIMGRMFYDNLLGIEVERIGGQPEKKASKLSVLLLSVVYLAAPVFLVITNLIAGAYTNCIELKFEYVGGKQIGKEEKSGLSGEWEMFSADGSEGAWAFVSKTEEHFLARYGKYGVDVDGLFEENVLVVTYGRELRKARILDDGLAHMLHGIEAMGSYPSTFLYLELGKQYKEDAVYFYSVPYIAIIENGCSVYWVDTDYVMFKRMPYNAGYCTIESRGILRRWAWAFNVVF